MICFNKSPIIVRNLDGSTVSIESVQAAMSYTNLVVAKCNAFEALLATSQINILRLTFTNELAQKRSNLPCGSSCRKGISSVCSPAIR